MNEPTDDQPMPMEYNSSVRCRLVNEFIDRLREDERVQKWGIPVTLGLAFVVCFLLAFLVFGNADCPITCRDFSCQDKPVVCAALNCTSACLSDQLECVAGTRHCVYGTWFFVFLALAIIAFVCLLSYLCPAGCY